MKKLIGREIEIDSVFPVPVGGHVEDPFFQDFDSVLQNLFFFIEWCLVLADFIHKDIFFEFCILLEFAGVGELVQVIKDVLVF
jgi:hypothetical protein